MKELLQHLKSTVAISDQHLEVVSAKFTEQHFSKKEHLRYFDHYAKRLYFTAKGCLRTYAIDFNGVEHNVSFAVENWWSGDLKSFLNKESAICNIQALEDSLVFSINRENWDCLVREIPAFVSYTRILFRNKLFAQQDRIIQNLSFTAKERYHHFLQEYPNLSQRIPQKYIASYLGITPEFLSMLRSRMKK